MFNMNILYKTHSMCAGLPVSDAGSRKAVGIFYVALIATATLLLIGTLVGCPAGTDADRMAEVDVDMDNDGLIDINFLEDLDKIRHDLDDNGTPADNSDDTHIVGRADGKFGSNGAPTTPTTNCTDNSGTADAPVYLCGYELMRSLNFALADDYAAGAVNMDWRPNNADPSMATNPGWQPLAHDTEIDDQGIDAQFFLFDGAQFNAILEGNGNSIANLYINRNDQDFVGLFGNAGQGSVVRNLVLTDVSVLGKWFVGGLAGINTGTISSSYSSGSVTGTGVGGIIGVIGHVGGLVGDNSIGSVISTSWSSGSVTGSGDNIGGLAGRNTGRIIASYSSSRVMGANLVGGAVGFNSAIVVASYSSGDVTGTTTIGGLVGFSTDTIVASYSTGRVIGTTAIGGLVGALESGTITNSYWDTTTTGQPTSAGTGAIGLSTIEMQAVGGVNFGGSGDAAFGNCGVAYQFNATAGTHYPRLRRYLGTDDDVDPATDCSNHSYHASELLGEQGQ